MLSKLMTLFKRKEEEKVYVEKTISNLKKGYILDFDFNPIFSVSNTKVTLGDTTVVHLQNGSGLTFHNLDNDMMLYVLDNSKIEVLTKANMSTFIDAVDDEFDNFVNIEENEISFVNGKEQLKSIEKSFSIHSEVDGIIPPERYFSVIDQVECSFNGKPCRFSRLFSLDKQNGITMVVYEGGDTEIYVSKVLHSNVIKAIY